MQTQKVKRNSRYDKILSEVQLGTTKILVIGTGAIGKNLVEMLVSIGFSDITICDGDKVGTENLGTQGFKEKDVGRFKVDCVEERCLELNPNCEITKHNNFFKRFNHEIFAGHDVVISCVDSMETRMDIFKALEELLHDLDKEDMPYGSRQQPLCIDSRMGLQNMSIVSFDIMDIDIYEAFWYSDAEAIRESCTTKSTLYCASAAAAIICGNIVKFVNMQSVPYHVNFNLINYESDVIGFNDACQLSLLLTELKKGPDYINSRYNVERLRKVAGIIYAKEIKF